VGQTELNKRNLACDRQADMKKKIRGGVFGKNICERVND